MKQKIKIWLVVFSSLILLCQSAFGEPAVLSDKENFSIEKILDQMEKRYEGPGFSALFSQISVIKAMEITDNASGTILIKRPGKMRWEYETPEKQLILTDGITMWVYRHEDRQVMIGRSPDYFGGGKGASFLSDMKLIRKEFDVQLEQSNERETYKIKLVPKEAKYDISKIFLWVSKKTFDILGVLSYNLYDDETRIEFSGYKFNIIPDDSQFNFIPPEGTEILQMEEKQENSK